MKIYFPKHIWNKIYEYDSTYHDLYKEVIIEFHRKTPYWRVLNINISDPTDTMIYGNGYQYKLSYEKATNICNYWNGDYIKNCILKNNRYNFWTQELEDELNDNHNYNYAECIFDTKTNAYKKLFRDLKNNRFD